MAQSKRSEQVRKYDKDTAVCVKDVSEMCQGCVKDVSSLTIFPPLEGKTLKVNDAKPNVSQMSVKCQSNVSQMSTEVPRI